jgi:metal-dependent amidase/aminoacylase/carboxypeptidase family protein
VLTKLYEKHAKSLGVTFPSKSVQESFPNGSTDMGNVSYVLPSLQPGYSIKSTAGNHTQGFAQAAGREEAQHPTLVAAKSMAMTTIDILCKPELLEKMKKTFREQLLLG